MNEEMVMNNEEMVNDSVATIDMISEPVLAPLTNDEINNKPIVINTPQLPAKVGFSGKQLMAAGLAGAGITVVTLLGLKLIRKKLAERKDDIEVVDKVDDGLGEAEFYDEEE